MGSSKKANKAAGSSSGQKGQASNTLGSDRTPLSLVTIFSSILVVVVACIFAALRGYGNGEADAEGEALFKWMHAHGAYVHAGLMIGPTSHGGLQIRGAKTRKAVAKGELLVRVPRNMWLDMNSLAPVHASHFEKHEACEGEEENILLAAGLALEAQKGDASFLAPMIQMLPGIADFREFHPFLAEDAILADFGELPLLQHLRKGYQADINSLDACFKAWKAEPTSRVTSLNLEDLIAARYQFKTRGFAGSTGALPAFLDLPNTGLPSEANIKHDFVGGMFEMRAVKAIPAGGEIINRYCADCDNEMMLAGWGVYLEKNNQGFESIAQHFFYSCPQQR
jgi:hypothetical protein